MKYKILLLSILSVLAVGSLKAQVIHLTLAQAVQLALSNSDEAKLSDVKILTAKSELNAIKNNQYPNFKLSGQLNYLTNANLNSKISLGNNDANGTGQSASSPIIDHLILGQASLSMPLFSGFKLKNAINASENMYQATTFQSKNSKEQIGIQTIEDCINLYKATKTIAFIEENLKSAKQRVKDFSNMEENGLLAKNDLLKAKLQEANVELALEEAKKNAKILNYKLSVFLKLSENTLFEIDESSILISKEPLQLDTISSRSDLDALKFTAKAEKNKINMAKSNYFPSVSFIGGYTALNIGNVLSIYNAMNFGIGISYDVSDVFKNKSNVEVAKSKAEEIDYTLNKATDQVKVQIENTKQNYLLALAKFKVYTQSKEQAIENYRIVKDKFNNGLADTNDLLEADVQQLESKINLANANASIAQEYYELITAQGYLTEKINN